MDLPNHVIEKILKFNFRNRHDSQIVCKSFYETSSRIFEERCWLKIDINDIVTKDPRKFNTILNPPQNCRARVHRNLDINFETGFSENDFCNEFWTFLETRGDFVNKLMIKGEVQYENVIKIFKNIKNVKELTFKNFKILPENFECLDLQELSKLSCFKIDNHSNYVIKKFKIRANSLKSFEWNLINLSGQRMEKEIGEFFARQSTLKHFKFGYGITRLSIENLLSNCLLESLKIGNFLSRSEENQRTTLNILNSQKQLKTIELTNASDEMLCSLIENNSKSLECLNINCNSNNENLKKLQAFKNLKTLIFFATHFSSEDFNDLKLPVTSLILESCTVPEDSMEKFANSFPALKSFEIQLYCFGRVYFDTEEFLKYFKNIEKLRIINGSSAIQYLEFNEDDYRNDNLKILDFQLPMKFNLDFFKNFQNLTELNILVQNDDKKSLKYGIIELFTKFNKLEKIFMTFRVSYLIDFDILALTKENPNLKVILLVNILINSTRIVKNIKKFRKLFDIAELECEKDNLKVKSYSLLLAKSEENLLNSREHFERIYHISLGRRKFKIHIDLQTIYRRALRYYEMLDSKRSIYVSDDERDDEEEEFDRIPDGILFPFE